MAYARHLCQRLTMSTQAAPPPSGTPAHLRLPVTGEQLVHRARQHLPQQRLEVA